MKIHGLILSVLLCVVPFYSNAGWQVAKPVCVPREPFFQSGSQRNKIFVPTGPVAHSYSQLDQLSRPLPIYAVSISGSLKENLERIMTRYRWRVVWKSPYDYNFDGRVVGSSLPNVIQKLLQPFPLQAVMYMSNRTLAIVPRAKYNA